MFRRLDLVTSGRMGNRYPAGDMPSPYSIATRGESEGPRGGGT